MITEAWVRVLWEVWQVMGYAVAFVVVVFLAVGALLSVAELSEEFDFGRRSARAVVRIRWHWREFRRGGRE